jgi:hypothetical protein
MTLDIASLAPRARERYLAIGRRYGSEDVLAQAHKTLLAHDKYGHLLVAYGFGLRDAERLALGRDRLHVSLVGRSHASTDRRILRGSHADARRRARDERICVRSVLELVLDTLYEIDQHEVAGRVVGALDETEAQPRKDQKLLEQFDTLEEVLVDPAVVAAMADRGGPDILLRLQQARTDLNGTTRQAAGKPEVSAVIDERDILDGIIVSLARAARKAARTAARHLGQPAIATEFKLTHLRSRPASNTNPDTPSDSPAAPGTDEPAAV